MASVQPAICTGLSEHLDHVMARSTEQLLERELERMRTGATDPCPDHLQPHGGGR